MKAGLSTYSLLQAIRAGEMTVLDVIDWIADNGGNIWKSFLTASLW